MIKFIPPLWPLACWGLDMVGKIPKTPGGFQYCFVPIEKFSKWIEVFSMVKSSTKKAVQFIKDISYRFGIPKCIITNLGTTFTGKAFWDHCTLTGNKLCYASIAHPQANGLLLDDIKARLYDTLKKVEGKMDERTPCHRLGVAHPA